MADSRLIDYIRNALAQGYGAENLRDFLIKKGYNAGEIDEAINIAGLGSVPTNQRGPHQGKEQNNNPKSVSDDEGIKRRNPLLVVLFTIISFGLYGIFWILLTTKELEKHTKSAPNPALVLLALIPIINIAYFWKYSKAINELTGFSAGGLFVLWLLIPPAAMALTQIELNKKAV